jgi:hypothetical protein
MFHNVFVTSLASFSQAVSQAFDPQNELFLWIWCAMGAILLAFLFAALYRLIVGKPIRRLLLKKALSPDTALTLADLDCDNFFYRFMLRPDALLRKMVSAVNEAKPVENCPESEQKEQECTKSSVPSAYYIPDASAYRAQRAFAIDFRTFLALPLAAIALFVLGLVLFWLLPQAF